MPKTRKANPDATDRMFPTKSSVPNRTDEASNAVATATEYLFFRNITADSTIRMTENGVVVCPYEENVLMTNVSDINETVSDSMHIAGIFLCRHTAERGMRKIERIPFDMSNADVTESGFFIPCIPVHMRSIPIITKDANAELKFVSRGVLLILLHSDEREVIFERNCDGVNIIV